MLGDISVAEHIYIACGYTDMRKSIDGLAAIVQEEFHLDPFSKSLFLFCGKRSDRIKGLLWRQARCSHHRREDDRDRDRQNCKHY